MTRSPAAVILAGGRSSRMGGVLKPSIVLAGSTLLDRTVHAVQAVGCRPIVVVGPSDGADGSGIVRVREEPPFSGPAAALAAGVAALPDETEEMLLLAADLVRPDRVVEHLGGRLEASDAVVLRAEGRAQWLCGRFRVAAVRRALGAYGPVEGSPLHAVLAPLEIAHLDVEPAVAGDIDTPEQLARASETFTEEET